MRYEHTVPAKKFMVELVIYGGFLAVYGYLKFFTSTTRLTMFFDKSLDLTRFKFFQQVNPQIALVLGLLVLLVVLFTIERLSVDIITLLLLLILVVTGILTPAEAFAGFSSEIVIILASIFVISNTLQKTGIMDAVANYLLNIGGKSLSRLTLMLMAMVGGLSMFISNTTATAVFVPSAMSVAHRIKVSPSKLLLPLAYASILGGTCTVIGTSTNVAVSGYMGQLGFTPFGLFEFLPVGLLIFGVGFLYTLAAGKFLLPDYAEKTLAEGYAIREYLSEIVVRSDSELVGQRIFDSALSKLDLQIPAVLRGKRKFRPNIRSKFEADDLLLVQGRADELVKVKETAGIDIKPELIWEESDWPKDQDGEPFKLAELLLVSYSELIGRTMKSIDFLQMYGVTVLAIYRHGHTLRDKLDQIRLRLGDLLLVQGPAERLEALQSSPDFWTMGELRPVLYRKRRGFYTLIFLIGAIIAGTSGLVPLSIAFLGAAVLVILFRCTSIEEAYELLDWRLIILISGMTAFGTAMEKTGTAEFLANQVVFALQSYGVIAVLAGCLILTVLLTQPMSNAAAALVVLPVALHAAKALGVNERTFAVGVMLAASVSLITPFEPSCLLVYGPGKYKFMDFVKVGGGLTVLLLLIILFLVPLFWPL